MTTTTTTDDDDDDGCSDHVAAIYDRSTVQRRPRPHTERYTETHTEEHRKTYTDRQTERGRDTDVEIIRVKRRRVVRRPKTYQVVMWSSDVLLSHSFCAC